MEKDRIGSKYYNGCMLGAAVGNSLGNCCRQENQASGFTNPLYFDGLMQLALFTAEGLLRATHRAKMHGSNGTFAEIVYESYQRWLKTQSVDFNDLVQLPQNDGWLIRRSEMYHKSSPVKNTISVLKKQFPGDISAPISFYSDYEAMMRVFPVGLMFPGDIVLSFQVGSETAALTHGAEEAYLCGGVYAALVSGVAGGKSLAESIESILPILDGYPKSGITVRNAITDALYFSDDLDRIEPDRVTSEILNFMKDMTDSENAADVLTLGLLCLLRFPEDFRQAVSIAVRYKAAPHAVGMLTGSLMGIIQGENVLPGDWLSSMKHKYIVIQIAQDLYTTIRGGIFIVDREWLQKYPGW